MPGFSDATAKKILDHLTGKATFAAPAAQYLALVTVAVTDADTAGTLTEAAYTGYARKQVLAADMSAAAGAGVNVEAHNTVQQIFANCTASTSTVIGWALVDSSAGAGAVLMFGTCSSTVISTTQTPPTIAASALSLKAD